MKKLIVKFMVLIGFIGIFGFGNQSDPANWSTQEINKWFEKGEWLNGWTVKPDGMINRREFAIAYFKNKPRWDKAFTYLKTTDLSKLEVGKHQIDGDNITITVSKYFTKEAKNLNYESHRQVIDLHYVIKGAERISVAPMSMKKDVFAPYDAAKDVELLTVTQAKEYVATPDKFFIFFSDDLHRPGLMDGVSSEALKCVVKVKAE